MKNLVVNAKAPIRILDFGGWTDTWFVEKGAVLNFAIQKYVHVLAIRRRKEGITIFAEDYDEALELGTTNPAEIDSDNFYNGHHDLLKVAFASLRIPFGLNVYVRSDVPPSLGTGTSAAVSVAILGALDYLMDRLSDSFTIAQTAHKLETDQPPQGLGFQCGVQDQYASAIGGINLIEIDSFPKVRISSLRLPPIITQELQNRLLLVCVSKGHNSSDVHKEVIAKFESGSPDTKKALEVLTQTAYQAKRYLEDGNFDGFASVMNQNNAAQKMLHQCIQTEEMEVIEKIAFANGALGVKINGAGAGGSLTILSDINNKKQIEHILAKEDFQIIECLLDYGGLKRDKIHF